MPLSTKKADESKKVWEALKDHVDRGEEALKLLESVYVEIGPYKRDEVKDETWNKVRDFFGFDDSE